jgi:hypothetical protein
MPEKNAGEPEKAASVRVGVPIFWSIIAADLVDTSASDLDYLTLLHPTNHFSCHYLRQTPRDPHNRPGEGAIRVRPSGTVEAIPPARRY